MKKKVLLFLIQSGKICFIAGIIAIISSLIFFKEGEQETVWLIVFAAGAFFILYWLCIIFSIGRCRLCGAFATVKTMTLINGSFYCETCSAIINKESKKKKGISV